MPNPDIPAFETSLERPDDTTAFAASPPSVPVTTTPPSLSPTSTRKCEGCASPHAGTYGSGRFCSATCAKKVGARHKWAARASAPGAPRRPPARHTIPDSPCESCAKLHDKSYGSGRFCSVHCARRVAATRKWEKSRSEKTKRLEAIRPAMLAPPPEPCPLPMLTGKRRRVVGRQFEQLSISDSPSMYVSHQYPHPRLDVNSTQVATPPPTNPTAPASSPVLSMPAPVHATYLPTPHMQYAQVHMQDGFASPIIYPTDARGSLCYGYPGVPSYAVHPTATPVDTASYTATSPSPSPSPSPIPQRPHLSYPHVSITPRRPPVTYIPMRGPAFETEAMSDTASPGRIDEITIADKKAIAATAQKPLAQAQGKDKPTETSESAARALLCLQRS